MNFEVVDGPEPLGAEAKSCLLRAARTAYRQLEAELDRLRTLNRRHMQGPIEATEAEMDCLAAGISWLWNTPTG